MLCGLGLQAIRPGFRPDIRRQIEASSVEFEPYETTASVLDLMNRVDQSGRRLDSGTIWPP